MHLTAEKEDFILVYPNAVNAVWNSDIDTTGRAPLPNVDDVHFFDVLLDALLESYNIDSNRVYTCGMSNGALMSMKLITQIPHRFAAAGAVAGAVVQKTIDNHKLTTPKPVVFIHGTDDTYVPINGSPGWYSSEQVLNFWINHNNCTLHKKVDISDFEKDPNCTITKEIYHDAQGYETVLFYTIENGGHTWPGTINDLKTGYICKSLNASAVLWDFFKDKSL